MSSRWNATQSNFFPSHWNSNSNWNKEDKTDNPRCNFPTSSEQLGKGDLICEVAQGQIFRWEYCPLGTKNSKNLIKTPSISKNKLKNPEHEKINVQFNTINIIADSSSYSYLLSPVWLITLITVFCILLTGLLLLLLRLKSSKLKRKTINKNDDILKNYDLNCLESSRESSKRQTYQNKYNTSTPAKVHQSRLVKVFKSDEFAPKQSNSNYTPLSCKKNSKISASTGVQRLDLTNFCLKDASPFSQNQSRCDVVRKLSDKFIEKLTKNTDQLSTYSTDLPSNLPIPYENNKFENSFSNIVELGTHPLGKIYKALHKLEGVYYTIKRIDINLKEGQDLRSNHVFKEVSAMVNLHHKNIVRLITSWVEEQEEEECDLMNLKKVRAQSEFKQLESPSNEESLDFEIVFEEGPNERSRSVKSQEPRHFTIWNKVSLFMQMEYCSGTSLNNYILGSECELTDSDIFFIFREIVEGLTYIHSKGLIHQNLNPDNIFINNKGEIKIGEFGVATVISEKANDTNDEILRSESSKNLIKQFERYSNKKYMNNTITDNKFYKDLEVNKASVHGNKVDVYSAGLILYELLGRYKTIHEKVKQIEQLKTSRKVVPQFKEAFPIQSSLIETMISSDLNKRPNAKEIKHLDSFILWETALRVNCK